MGLKMNRGKQQVLFNYLPGSTFDFERVATIARIVSIRGVLQTDLNAAVVLRKITEEARAWHLNYRPLLRDGVLRDPARFVLLDPRTVQAEMFPKVFWCQNRSCGRVLDYSYNDSLPPKICLTCHQGELVQLRFVRIHRCGALQPLRPPTCQQCHTASQMALDSRGSERISNFRWICRQCNTATSVFGGWCSECQWPNGDPKLRRMDIEVHRSGRTFYAHTVILLNIPHHQLDAFLNLSEWSAIVAAKFFALPEMAHRSLSDFALAISGSQTEADAGLSGVDLNDLLRRQENGELTPEEFVAEMKTLRQQRQQEHQELSPSSVTQALEQRTGIPRQTWEQAGQEILEATMLLENTQLQELFNHTPPSSTTHIARHMGLSRLSLVTDFPIITATYGYSRAEYAPNQCRLNPFPPEREHGGKFPIFVDQVQADALLLSLNYNRVCVWLERNGFAPILPAGSDTDLSRQAYFVQLFNTVSLCETLHNDRPQARMVFSLLHTLSHLCVRQAALLCGLDRTSLSEYVLPRVLTFVLYSNHRFGAAIGALTALFEQSLGEWLNAVRDTRRCVYDPVCYERESSCHACTHLAETSCRFFNLNLSRALLFGGPDPQLGYIKLGYFDPLFPREERYDQKKS